MSSKSPPETRFIMYKRSLLSGMNCNWELCIVLMTYEVWVVAICRDFTSKIINGNSLVVTCKCKLEQILSYRRWHKDILLWIYQPDRLTETQIGGKFYFRNICLG